MISLIVKVKPNAKQQSVTRLPDGTWAIQLKSPPTAGKANQELIALLAKKLGVTRCQIRIKSGQTNRIKRIEIDADQ